MEILQPLLVILDLVVAVDNSNVDDKVLAVDDDDDDHENSDIRYVLR